MRRRIPATEVTPSVADPLGDGAATIGGESDGALLSQALPHLVSGSASAVSQSGSVDQAVNTACSYQHTCE